MSASIDKASPIPLYHQIAEILRYRIATGRLRPGECLPSVREAADIWEVNLHTVRRAYQELAAVGVVEIRAPRAARVIGVPRSEASVGRKVDRFLEEVVQAAAREHDLTPHALANLLIERSSAAAHHNAPVHVVECSEIQARGHAEEIEKHWQVTALPWSLERSDEPPAGPLAATFFHYNDVRVRWPHRLAQVHFFGIQPDPDLVDAVPPPRRGRRLSLYLCEFDLPIAKSVAADLSQILPADTYRIRPEVIRSPSKRLATGARGPLLFPPRVWSRLTAKERRFDRAIEVPYKFLPDELEALGRRFGWRRRSSRS